MYTDFEDDYGDEYGYEDDFDCYDSPGFYADLEDDFDDGIYTCGLPHAPVTTGLGQEPASLAKGATIDLSTDTKPDTSSSESNNTKTVYDNKKHGLRRADETELCNVEKSKEDVVDNHSLDYLNNSKEIQNHALVKEQLSMTTNGAFVKYPIQEHTPSAVSQDEIDIEANVKKYKNMISLCLKEPTVVSYLSTILTIDESTRLKRSFEERSSEGAYELIDVIMNLDVQGKWKAFLDALKSSGYPYLVDRLLNKQHSSQSEEYEKKMIQIFSPTLEKHLMVIDVLSELCACHVITDIDRQEVMAKLESRGNACATIVLLDRIQCRTAPAEWYGKFLEILHDKDYDELVATLEPEFLTCSSLFQKNDAEDDGSQEDRPVQIKQQKPEVESSVSNISAMHTHGTRTEWTHHQISVHRHEEKSTRECSKCEEEGSIKVAEFYCENCNHMLCKACLYYHNRFLKGHIIYGENEQDRWMIPPVQQHNLCREHRQQYTLYCTEHETLCCVVCETSNHGASCKDKFQLIPNAAKNYTKAEEFNDFLLDLSIGTAIVNLEISEKRFFKSKLQSSKQLNRGLVKKFRNKIVAQLDELVDKTLSQMDEKYDEIDAATKEDIGICADVAERLQQMKLLTDRSEESQKFIFMKTGARQELHKCLKQLNTLQYARDIELLMDQTIPMCVDSQSTLVSVEEVNLNKNDKKIRDT